MHLSVTSYMRTLAEYLNDSPVKHLHALLSLITKTRHANTKHGDLPAAHGLKSINRVVGVAMLEG